MIDVNADLARVVHHLALQVADLRRALGLNAEWVYVPREAAASIPAHIQSAAAAQATRALGGACDG